MNASMLAQSTKYIDCCRSHRQAVKVTTADKAALVASHQLGWLNHVTSLESLARKAGVGHANLDALALQYRENWLSSINTKIMLGIIP